MDVNNPISVTIFYNLWKAFVENANPADAVHMMAYMKNKFPFFGIKSKRRREIQRTVLGAHRTLDDNETLSLVIICWEQNEREFQYAAMDILDKVKKSLTINHLMMIEYLIVTKSWWDTVDKISSHFVGEVFKKNSQIKEETIQNWIESSNIWLQRSCLLFQLNYKEETDFKFLTALILYFKTSKEFFIQKAGGWSLRQYSKINPEAVAEFLSENPELASLTKKEAGKYL